MNCIGNSREMSSSSASITSGESTTTASSVASNDTWNQTTSKDDDGEAEFRALRVYDWKDRRRRCRLPVNRDRSSFSLWSFAKSVIGLDLTKITMPVHFNEPLSFTQRICEDLENAEILHTAHKCKSSLDRIAHIAAFAVSCFASAEGRFYKPFNPLLGETFESVRNEFGYAVLSEQVCHHPPITAMHCEAEHWSLWQEYKLDIRFRGQYLKVIPTGLVHLRMKSDGTHYTWRKPVTTVHNLILGRLWVDNEGDVVVTCHQTQETASLRFQSYSKVGKSFKELHGEVKNRSGDVEYVIKGTWDKGLDCYEVKSRKGKVIEAGPVAFPLWRLKDRLPDAHKMFGFTSLALQLNEMEDNIAATDSRLRPDIQLMENGRVDDAGKEKHRLEEKQRAAKRLRDSEKKLWKPRWFTPQYDSDTNTTIHRYTGGYWRAKLKREFTNIPDIY